MKRISTAIPSLCLCGCNEIIWGGEQYVNHHYSKTEEFKKQVSEKMKGNTHALKYMEYLQKTENWVKFLEVESKEL